VARSLPLGLIALVFSTACGSDDPGGPDVVVLEAQVVSARSGAGLAGATVSIGSLAGTQFVTTTTDSEGRFTANVEVVTCEGVSILAELTGYQQSAPYPNVCPGSSRTIELAPLPASIVISPQDPTVGPGGTIDFQVQVTFFDGTTEEDGEAVWFIAEDGTLVDTSVCGSIPPGVPAPGGTTYTAPSAPPPVGCGGAAGQAAVVAAAAVGLGPGSGGASDTVLVTVTP
jgi:hypothetical protein